jgi:hypothetical protein
MDKIVKKFSRSLCQALYKTLGWHFEFEVLDRINFTSVANCLYVYLPDS